MYKKRNAKYSKASRTIKRLRRQDRYALALKNQSYTALRNAVEVKSVDIPGLNLVYFY